MPNEILIPFAKTLDHKYVKSYKSVANLKKALAKANLQNHRMIICRTIEGDITCVILGSTAINGEGTPGRGPALGTGFLIAS